MSVIGLLSGASLLAGMGVGVWELDARKRRKRAIAQHVQALLDLRKDSANELVVTQALAQEVASGLPWGPLWLRHSATWRKVCIALALATVLAIPIASMGWVMAALGLWSGVVAVGLFFAWRSWEKMRLQMRVQLPNFIDNMVRMVVLGHAVQSAFLYSAASSKMPLQATLNQAAAYAKAGMPVDEAVAAASRNWDMEEFFLLAAIMQVGSRFGGRIDSLLERVANFMRDREQAKQELHALSAEVRLSAWVLGLLPIGIGGMVIVTNPNYFLQMWNDASGRNLLFLAMGLQATGGVLLYRLARMN